MSARIKSVNICVASYMESEILAWNPESLQKKLMGFYTQFLSGVGPLGTSHIHSGTLSNESNSVLFVCGVMSVIVLLCVYICMYV